MALDVATITLAGGFVTFFSGVFLLVLWWQDRSAWPAFWWGIGSCGHGAGVALVGFHSVLPFVEAHILAPLLLDLSSAFPFIAARLFNRGSIAPWRSVAGVAAWMALLVLTGAVAAEQVAATFGVATSACCYIAAAREFWLGRSEALRGRMPIIAVVALYGVALFMLAAQFALMTDFVPVASTGWLGLVRFVGLFYALGVAFFLNMMLTGRGENRYRAAALTDPLTGLANRRAFMEQGQRILDRQGQDGKPAALLLFDLDRFKRINDSFGHATGDRVLHVFADVLSETLRPVDLVARIGGEEFVAVVPGVDAEAAVAIANRTRDTLEKMALLVDGRRVGATVSVGVAASAGRQRTVIDMLAEADQALYRAKDGGRNRVVLADATGRPETAKIVHVA